MRKLIFTAGVAALAIAAPAAAKPGGGHGGGQQAQQEQKQQGGGQKAQRQRGGGGGQAQVQRGGGGGQRAMAFQRGGGERQVQRQQFAIERHGGGQERHAQRLERRGGGQRFANFQTERGNRGQAQRIERQNVQRIERSNRVAQRIERQANRQPRMEDRANQRVAFENGGHGNRELRFDNRGKQAVAIDRGARDLRVANREFSQRVLGDRYWDDRNFDRVHNTAIYADRGLPAAFIGGCPPGLAKKSPACVPPGLAQQQFVGQVLPTVYASNYFPTSLRYLYADTPDYYYRYGDGYAYRVNRADNLIAALLPLIGAGYGIGQPFPYMSDPYYYVPSSYQSFYPNYGYGDGGDYYRYANGYVYEIDGGTGYIEDVIPLLDRGYGVGQMLPVGYSYYNVPYQYRDLYYDTGDYYYRYAPGAIYQVDPQTQLVTAIASLLTGGLSVGQPLPPSYSVYNVPMAYRDVYYDRPDAWYRYSDGYIYQVDPTTQLITAIVRSIV